ncbi:MAG: hypothetical protein WCF82_19440 [Microcoleus sp.]
MNQGFAPVFATPKSKQPQNPPQPISMQELQGSLSSYFDDVPDTLGEPNQTPPTERHSRHCHIIYSFPAQRVQKMLLKKSEENINESEPKIAISKPR